MHKSAAGPKAVGPRVAAPALSAAGEGNQLAAPRLAAGISPRAARHPAVRARLNASLPNLRPQIAEALRQRNVLR